MRALREAFRPEFLDRIDECIFFSPLSDESIRKICKRQLEELANKLASKSIELNYTDAAVDHICQTANAKGGARHIRRRISKLCERPISEKILSGVIKKSSKILLTTGSGEDELTIDIQ